MSSTAHGVEVATSTYRLPSDHPFERGYAPGTLQRHAISVHRLTSALKAARTNPALFRRLPQSRTARGLTLRDPDSVIPTEPGGALGEPWNVADARQT